MYLKEAYFCNIYLVFVFFLFLFFKGNYTCFAQNDDIIYDTVWVYDTVWEYETVYDTVWEYELVYDTIYVDENFDPFRLVQPKGITQLSFSPRYYKIKTYPKHEKTVPIKLVKRSVLSKLRYEFRQNRANARNRLNLNLNSDVSVTLNPSKGTFDPRVLKYGAYGLGVYSGPAFHKTSYQYKNIESAYVKNQDSIEALSSYEYGVRLSFNVFQYGIRTGLGISHINDKFFYSDVTFHRDSTPFKIPNYYWDKVVISDSIQNLDSALVGVDYWRKVNYTKDTLIRDSIFSYNYDTTWFYNHKSIINTISYLEIPFVFTYDLAISQLNVQFQVGGVNQIYTMAKGKLYSGSGRLMRINDLETFKKYNLALYGGLGLLYKFTSISFMLDAYYKYPLFKVSSNSNVITFRQTYGISAGIQFTF